MSLPHTKERILDAAEELMWTKGFHPVGLNEILTAVGVPKGSFYHYFKSKEHFGVEMLKHYIQAATADKRHAVDACDGDPDPINRLLDMLAESIVIFEEKGGRCPCLVLKLASEVSDSSEPMREVLAKGMQTWLGVLTAPFDEALMKGIIPKEYRYRHGSRNRPRSLGRCYSARDDYEIQGTDGNCPRFPPHTFRRPPAFAFCGKISPPNSLSKNLFPP